MLSTLTFGHEFLEQQFLNQINISKTEPPHIRNGTSWAQNGIPYNGGNVFYFIDCRFIPNIADAFHTGGLQYLTKTRLGSTTRAEVC